MDFAKCYFPQSPSFPPVLMATSERRVRFEEADMLGMVRHGRYTVQLFAEMNGKVIPVVPAWLREFRKKWRGGVWYR